MSAYTTRNFTIQNSEIFKQRALCHATKYSHFALYETLNQELNPYFPALSIHHDILAVGAKRLLQTSAHGAFHALHEFTTPKNWYFGYLGYDLKNDTEALQSNNYDPLNFPDLCFFEAQFVFKIHPNYVQICAHKANIVEAECLFYEILSTDFQKHTLPKLSLKSRLNKADYITRIDLIKAHILAGNIYELNFCNEFYNDATAVDPISLYQHIRDYNPAPFAAFFKADDKYCIAASPERFLRKIGSKLISQPMKGTIRRSSDTETDKQLRQQLATDPKERAENIMITDLVRNDLSRIASPNSVRVSELCGIYRFAHVHQMITTIEATLPENYDLITSIKHCFPMGSMTGAPKKRAMELIEHYELNRRGAYAGALGYIDPNQDFDFSVLIRTFLYDRSSNYLSLHVGSAITALSDPQREWLECQLKANSLLKAFLQ
jgi:para-aminobenzoate synthetase component 1